MQTFVDPFQELKDWDATVAPAASRHDKLNHVGKVQKFVPVKEKDVTVDGPASSTARLHGFEDGDHVWPDSEPATLKSAGLTAVERKSLSEKKRG